MSRRFKLMAALALTATALWSFNSVTTTYSAGPPAAAGDAARGAYVFVAAGGCHCHTTSGGLLAGGNKFAGPFGIVYSKNITPDSDTGIGKWSDQQIMDAIRLGKDDTGKQLFPIMPYAAYSGMSDQDVANLVAYLRTVRPVKNAVPEDHLKFPAPPFTPRAAPPATAPTSGTARGAYLVSNVSDCGGCHTPSKPDGSPDFSKLLAGGFNPDLGLVPNITPDNDTGIGKWTTDEIAALLKTGKKPDGTMVVGAMAGLIQGAFKNLTDADAQAIASYLKTIPAVKNTPQAPQTLPTTGGAGNGMSALMLAVTTLGVLLVVFGLSLRRYRAVPKS